MTRQRFHSTPLVVDRSKTHALLVTAGHMHASAAPVALFELPFAAFLGGCNLVSNVLQARPSIRARTSGRWAEEVWKRAESLLVDSALQEACGHIFLTESNRSA